MSERELFKGLPEFLAVSRAKNFRKAAAALGISPVAVGTTIRQLEERLEAKLFHRTTRRVELTTAGILLLDRLEPLAGALRETLEDLQDRRVELGGTLRICVQELALDTVLDPALRTFAARHPGVAVHVEIREGRPDLLAERFDMGVRLGEYIQGDMVAMRIPQPVNWRVVGARDYFDRNGRPEVPKDVMGHHCIRRHVPGQDQVYRWEFAINQRVTELEPPGNLTVSSFSTAKGLVGAGLGLGYLTVGMCRALSARTAIQEVLTSYMPPANYLYAYFSPANRDNRRVRAFLDCIRGLEPVSEI